MRHDPLDYSSDVTRQPLPVRAKHVLIVLAAVMASSVVVYATAMAYGSIRGGELFLMGIVFVAMLSVVPFIIALLVSKSGRRFKIGLAIGAFVPSFLFALAIANNDRREREEAPSRTFRELVINPMPASVANVQFDSELNKSIYTVKFNISAADFDQVLKAKSFSQVARGAFRWPIDDFKDPNYLRFGDEDEFYQRVANGFLYTIRADKTHTRAVLREENAPK